jgi:rare lipoprotein A
MGCKAKRCTSTGYTWLGVFLCVTLVQFLIGCATLEPFGKVLDKPEIPKDWGTAERGWASFYHPALGGRKTASGEMYRRYAIVRINDRGPFVKGRVIDLSRAAAARLGLIMAGVGKVEVFVIPPEHPLIAHL